MKLNKRFKYAVAAVLVLALLVSAFLVLPGAPKTDDAADAADTVTDAVSPLAHPAGYAPVGDSAGVISTVDEPTAADATEADEAAPSEPEEPTEAPTEVPGEGSFFEPTTISTEPPAEEDPPTADEPTEILPVQPTEPTEPIEPPTEEPTTIPPVIGDIHTIDRTALTDGVLGLEWNAAEGAQGYHVYWRDVDVDDSAYTLLSSVKDTSLTIRNLKKGRMYSFRITGYASYEGRLIDGEGAELRAGTVPESPTGFYLASCASTGTLLKWNATKLCDGYVLYREFDGGWSRYQVLKKTQTEFRDTDVIPGRAYNYRLCTYREDSTGILESDSPATVKTVCGLSAPTDNGTYTLLCKVYFKWAKNPYAHGYEIHYSTDNKNFKLLTDTNKTYFTTHKLSASKPYYFRIYPYRYVGSSKTKIMGTYMARTETTVNSAYGKPVGDTYIEINIAQQHMWYYIKGELYVSTDVVTGNYNSMDTPKGYWEINSKASPATLVGADYTSYVDYWMAFIGSGYGIHDASWRSSFGGQIYKGNGSHGCVNTPFAAVKKMYGKVTIGTPVIIY